MEGGDGSPGLAVPPPRSGPVVTPGLEAGAGAESAMAGVALVACRTPEASSVERTSGGVNSAGAAARKTEGAAAWARLCTDASAAASWISAVSGRTAFVAAWPTAASLVEAVSSAAPERRAAAAEACSAPTTWERKNDQVRKLQSPFSRRSERRSCWGCRNAPVGAHHLARARTYPSFCAPTDNTLRVQQRPNV